MIEIKEINDSSTWEQFQIKQKFSNLLQSWNWGEFQKILGRKIWRLGIYNNSVLVGTCLCHKIPTKLRTHIYTSNGPEIDWQDTKVIDAIFTYLKQIGQEEKVKFVRLDPTIDENMDNLRMLKSRGMIEAGTNVQAERKWYLDITPTEDELLVLMKKNTRYSIHRSEREGVVVKKSTNIEDFPKFWDLFTQTVERQKFVPHSKDYYINQIKSFPNSYYIYWSEYKGKVLATALIPFYGNTAYYLHAASDNSVKNTFPAHLLIWTAIKDAKAQGLKYFDFWGIAPTDDPKHPWAGFTFFKQGFGGFERRLIRAHDIPLSPQYKLIRLLESSRRFWGRAYFRLIHK